jgi:hypothetical protein
MKKSEDIKVQEFIAWLSRIDVSYESLTQEEKIKLQRCYKQSRPPPGIIWYWFPFLAERNTKRKNRIKKYVEY